jgi:maltose O-acetyltransferase
MAAKTEKQKMLAGEVYNCLDEELEADRQRVKAVLRRYNAAEDLDERRAILAGLLGGLGQNSGTWSPFYCVYGENIYFGDNVFLNYECVILDTNEIRIGNHIMIGPGVHIYASAHMLEAGPRNEGLEIARPITVEDNVWIGGRAILLPGVRVGRNSVVGAGAVVTKDVPQNVVVAGNPARVIRRVGE